jgi:hypothetical protein
MVATDAAALAIAGRRLDRHDGRRSQGVPTVTVLAGSARTAAPLLSRWAADRGRLLAWLEPERPEPRALAEAWTGRLAAGSGLVDEAIAWLEGRLDRPEGSLGPSLRGKTPFELALYLDRVIPSDSITGVETACRWALSTAAEQGWREFDQRAPVDFSKLGDELESAAIASPRVQPGLRELVAFGELVAIERQPVLALVHPERGARDDPGARAWVEQAARILADLTFAQPRLACCLVLKPELLRAYLDRADESRAKALVRESVVTVPDEEPDRGGAEGPIITPLGPAGSAATTAPCVETLDPDHDNRARSPDHDDRARSVAERLLFDRLEAMPETAGLFRLNETIDLAFGHNRKMEIDLAAPTLALAIEIDGYYHFQDPEAYRRDRRKDLELQKHGHMVVRVLAEDVLAEPGKAIETILGAIAFRRGVSELLPRDDS